MGSRLEFRCTQYIQRLVERNACEVRMLRWCSALFPGGLDLLPRKRLIALRGGRSDPGKEETQNKDPILTGSEMFLLALN